MRSIGLDDFVRSIDAVEQALNGGPVVVRGDDRNLFAVISIAHLDLFERLSAADIQSSRGGRAQCVSAKGGLLLGDSVSKGIEIGRSAVSIRVNYGSMIRVKRG